MRVISLLIFIGSVAEWSGAQFLNNRPFPTYSLESMPDTDFTCRDKVLGGYYADPETECQMFHICVKVAGVGVQDFRFLCPNGTAFDQDHQICAEWGDVDCDATTLYYSSDNFDLYRIGSGFESKAVKYGEEEETFALQRAETGDARINHEHQVQRVNQQKQLESANFARKKPTYQYNNADNSERDILKGSSSSNFYNNRNGGKDLDEDDDDRNVNVNQDRDQEQRRKVSRPQNRRPQNQNGQSRRPSGFINNFAGSSYATSPKPVSSTAASVSEQQPVTRVRNGRPRQNNGQYNNGDNFRQDRNYDNNNQNNYNQGSYTISTPAPFRQTQQFNSNNNNNNNNNQYVSTTIAPKIANDNYPSTFPQQKQTFQTKQTENYPSTYNQPRSSFPTTTTVQQKSTFTQKETENYPSSFPKKQTSSYPTTPLATYESTKVKQTQNYPSPSTQKQQTTPAKPTDNYPTTYSPSKQTAFQNYPSTFSPRTNSAFTQLSQQTTQQQSQQFAHNSQSTQQNRQQFSQNTQQYNSQSTQFNSFQATTSKPSPFTQYTPTVPKVSSTTPVIRSNRFDETHYDDGSYHQKYDNYDNKDSNEEFLKTAHSTNIAASRNELAKAAKTTLSTSTTAKPFYDSPRPFSVSSTNTPKATEAPKAIANVENPSTSTTNTQSAPAKKDKNVSYDYAYYDSNPQHDHEYEIDTDFKKSAGNKQ